jgi:hypothetical protein
MAMINGTNFKGNGKFHQWLVRAIALRPLILIGFSLGTVITAPALALDSSELCPVPSQLPWCPYDGGGSDFEPPLEPKQPKEPKEPKEPNPKPKPKPNPNPKPKPKLSN